jgi:hypothetical protein
VLARSRIYIYLLPLDHLVVLHTYLLEVTALMHATHPLRLTALHTAVEEQRQSPLGAWSGQFLIVYHLIATPRGTFISFGALCALIWRRLSPLPSLSLRRPCLTRLRVSPIRERYLISMSSALTARKSAPHDLHLINAVLHQDAPPRRRS